MELFLTNEVLSRYNLFPSTRLVIVIDDVSLYYLKEIKRLYYKVDIIIKYLPSFLANFSSINKFFLVIKS